MSWVVVRLSSPVESAKVEKRAPAVEGGDRLDEEPEVVDLGVAGGHGLGVGQLRAALEQPLQEARRPNRNLSRKQCETTKARY